MRGFESWRSEKSDGSSNFEQLWFENAKKFLDYQRFHQSDYQDKGLGVVFADNDAIADRIFSFKNKVEADADCDVDRVADADRIVARDPRGTDYFPCLPSMQVTLLVTLICNSISICVGKNIELLGL